MRKAAPFGAAFPLSAEAATMSGADVPRGGGRAHPLRRDRHVTMRHRTTSFPLLNDGADVGRGPYDSSFSRGWDGGGAGA